MAQTINFDDLGGKQIASPGQVDFSDLEAPTSSPSVPPVIANASSLSVQPDTPVLAR